MHKQTRLFRQVHYNSFLARFDTVQTERIYALTLQCRIEKIKVEGDNASKRRREEIALYFWGAEPDPPLPEDDPDDGGGVYTGAAPEDGGGE
jgi:hypothetical protein